MINESSHFSSPSILVFDRERLLFINVRANSGALSALKGLSAPVYPDG